MSQALNNQVLKQNVCLITFALNPAPGASSLLSRSAARMPDIMAGEHPLQRTVTFPSGEMQVRVFLWSPSQNTNVVGFTFQPWHLVLGSEVKGQSARVGERWSRAGAASSSTLGPPALEAGLRGSGSVGEWTPGWWPRATPRALWSPSVSPQTRQPLPPHFQQSTSDYLFMTLQHSFSSNFMAFH